MKTMTNYSQHQKILVRMCLRPDKKWWFPYDFMDGDPLGGIFVGYEASARLSELAKRYPDMVESENAGKYIRRRLRFETISQWLPDLPKDLRYVIHRTGVERGEAGKGLPAIPEPVKPTPTMEITATYKGRKRYGAQFEPGTTYTLAMEKLIIGRPVTIVKPWLCVYATVRAFQQDWSAT